MEKRLNSLKVSEELTLRNGNVVMRLKHGYLVEVFQDWKESILLQFDNIESLIKWLGRK